MSENVENVTNLCIMLIKQKIVFSALAVSSLDSHQLVCGQTGETSPSKTCILI
jgi:hypothetical protein